MKFLKYIPIILALSLGGCAQLQQVTDGFKTTVSKIVNPDTFDSITLAYAAVSAAGNTYYNLCRNKTINKSCWKIIATLQPYENNAFNAYMTLDAFVKSNPNGDAASLMQLARSAINSLQSLQLQYGVK